MKPLTLRDACIALDIDETTLYRWCRVAGIHLGTDPYDKRRRTITAAQVNQLSALHHRPLQEIKEPEQETYQDILTRVERLEEQVTSLDAKITAFSSQTHQIPVTTEQATSVPQEPQKKASEEIVWLEDDVVAWRSFARAHGIEESKQTKIQKAITSGRLPTVAGEWRRGKTPYTRALDEYGRRVFHELYKIPLPCPVCGMS